MTYLATETSIELGSPIELFDIRYMDTEWNYTSGDVQFNDPVLVKTYTPIAIARSNLEFSSDFSRMPLELRIRHDIPFLDLFRSASPSGVISLTIRKFHRLDGAAEIITVWKGRIRNANFIESEVQLTCLPIRASVERMGLRRTFQFNCPYALYSGPSECGVDKTLFAVTGNVSAVSGSNVTIVGVNAFAAEYFSGGFIEYTNSVLGNVERRMITSNPGGSNVVTLVSPPLNLTIGTTAIAYPGCDHTLATCESKFSNSENFGGFPNTPTNKGPFAGETIY